MTEPTKESLERAAIIVSKHVPLTGADFEVDLRNVVALALDEAKAEGRKEERIKSREFRMEADYYRREGLRRAATLCVQRACSPDCWLPKVEREIRRLADNSDA